MMIIPVLKGRPITESAHPLYQGDDEEDESEENGCGKSG
jgi:hypothetical protein